ncbi:MAG TPA: FecR family protein [Bryobacteraceae bacterium]|nr:FecR family protein [Bryobacteraceae bacterium]
MRRRGTRALGVGLLLAATVAVCSAQMFQPSSPASAAKVISLTGQVSVLHDSQPWALNIGDMVQTQQVILTGPDGFAQFQVSDGSTFEVYPNSNIVFRKNPGSIRDLLDVLVGKVKVHIQKWGGQPNFNRVLTPTAVISVRGTTFDVSVNDDDESTIVSVEEGLVDVSNALKPGGSKTLHPGEEIHVYRDQPLSKSLIDKGGILQRIMRGLADAVYTVATNGRGTGTGGGTGPNFPGQTGPPKPPSGPPPPPPGPPPPPH